ncbi:MAG: fumarylacetoacetate hydrolase family protein [Robiginitomaculum sp.]
MIKYSVIPPTIISLPIVNSEERFPVRRIYCVGQNYIEHVAEMGGDPKKSTPIFFTKSRETIVQTGAVIPIPPLTNDLQYEVELVVAMESECTIFSYGVGIDMTRRDQQRMAKQGGKPWDMAKNFDNSAPCSALMRNIHTPHLNNADIALTKNGEVMQSSNLNKMIWSVNDILKVLRQSVTLAAGDLIYTGTPHGVGSVVSGDTIIGTIDGLPSIEVSFIHG